MLLGASPVQALDIPLLSLPDVLAQGRAASQGWPGNRVGGGTRSALCNVSFPSDQVSYADLSPQERLPWHLVGIMPQDNVARTGQHNPEVFWYMPPTNARYAEFNLYKLPGGDATTTTSSGSDLAQDGLFATETLIYRSGFRIDGEAGLVSFQMPQGLTMPPLAVGDRYSWEVRLHCNTNDATQDPWYESALNLTSAGTESISSIQGELLPMEVAVPLNHSGSLLDQANEAFSAGLWLDGLSNLMGYYCEVKDDPAALATFQNRWQEVLNEQNLGGLAQMPIQRTCNPN